MRPEEMTDEQLAIAIREHNQELYAEIIRRYHRRLVHYLRKFIHRQEQLEDVLQDVFIKSFRNLFSFDASKKFSSWIYRIAHNEAINYIRKNAKEVLLFDQDDWDALDQKLDVSDSVDAILRHEKVSVALSQLKEKYRAPLILHYLEQRTYEEVGDILRLPVSTVGVRINRAKAQMKKLLPEGKTYG